MARHLLAVATSLVVLISLWSLAVPPTFAADPASSPVATSSSPAPAPQGNAAPDKSGGLQGFLPDPKAWAADVFNQVLIDALSGLAVALNALVQTVMSSSLNFISQTPPSGSYASPTVVALWGTVRTIANAGLAVVTLWSGLNLMVRDHIGSTYHEAMEVFPRLVLAALLVNTSLWWGQLTIDVNNALCSAIGQASLPAWQQSDTATQALANVMAGLIYVVASLLLLLQMLMRLAFINVLLVAAPIGLLCWVLPQTRRWAGLWSNSYFGAVFTQFVQVLALKVGVSQMTELQPMAADAALLAVFAGFAAVAMTLKLPGILRSELSNGSFGRSLVHREAARSIETRFGASAAATAVVPAAGAAAGAASAGKAASGGAAAAAAA